MGIEMEMNDSHSSRFVGRGLIPIPILGGKWEYPNFPKSDHYFPLVLKFHSGSNID